MKFPIFKEMLSRAGVCVTPRMVHYASGILNYLSVGRWFHEQNLSVPLRCDDRPSLYAAVAKNVKEPASYLEFGVFTGSSLREWIQLLRNPESTFDGFDSFEGLPEDWGHFTSKEVFHVGKDGIPQFDDPRVHLHKGWFTDTVPPFLREFRPRPNLVLHLDADLYSSTIFALRQMRPYMQPGTILIFDEFFDREHELKAFNEFLKDERMRVKCLAATRALTQAAFEIVELNGKRDALHETSRKPV